MKFLGVFIDDRLSFSRHIAAICSKVSRSLAVMRRLSRMVPANVMKSLYLSLVYPHITYAVEVWGSSSKTGLGRLLSLMVRCVSLIGGAETGGDVYGRHGLLDFNNVYRTFTLIRMYKYINLGVSDYFLNKYIACGVQHGISTRFSNNRNLNLPPIHKSLYRNSFFINSIKHWNDLPILIKNLTSVYSFKKQLKSQYSRS